MRLLFLGLLTFGLTIFTLPIAGAAPTATKGVDNVQNDADGLHKEIKTILDDISILRRDQVNYRMEKDLLKDAYASNLQTINAVVTIVLGFFGVIGALLGYIGFKSIQALQADYKKELDELRDLKINLENEVKAVVERQESVKQDVSSIEKINEEQERRLRVLEIVEKASQYFESGQFQFALEFVAAGLSIDPENARLLNMKALCHNKLGEFQSALDPLKRAHKADPTSASIATNLAEGYLLCGRLDDFDEIYESNRQLFDASHGGALIAFLNAFRAFVEGDVGHMRDAIRNYVAGASPGTSPRMGTWSFAEVDRIITRAPDGPAKSMFSEVVGFFRGTKSKELMGMFLMPPPTSALTTDGR